MPADLAKHDTKSAGAASNQLRALAQDAGQMPRRRAAILVILQGEGDAFCAQALGNTGNALHLLKDAAAKESALGGVAQPVFAPPAHELYAQALLAARRNAEAAANYRAALALTPNRPQALRGLAIAAERMHDPKTASAMQQAFDAVWKDADRGAPRRSGCCATS